MEAGDVELSVVPRCLCSRSTSEFMPIHSLKLTFASFRLHHVFDLQT